MINRDYINTIILAAGKSKRANRDKQLFKIKNKRLIEVTVEKFLQFDKVKKVIIAVSKKNIKKYSKIFRDNRIILVEGGRTRNHSLLNASKYIDKNYGLVMVHDGARPFLSISLIKKLYSATLKYGCVVPVVPLKDTVKEIDLKTGKVIKTIDRNKHFIIQTPQCYKTDIFRKIISKLTDFSITDDSQLALNLGYKVYTIPGEDFNLKLTTPFDLEIAEVIYEKTKKI